MQSLKIRRDASASGRGQGLRALPIVDRRYGALARCRPYASAETSGRRKAPEEISILPNSYVNRRQICMDAPPSMTSANSSGRSIAARNIGSQIRRSAAAIGNETRGSFVIDNGPSATRDFAMNRPECAVRTAAVDRGHPGSGEHHIAGRLDAAGNLMCGVQIDIRAFRDTGCGSCTTGGNTWVSVVDRCTGAGLTGMTGGRSCSTGGCGGLSSGRDATIRAGSPRPAPQRSDARQLRCEPENIRQLKIIRRHLVIGQCQTKRLDRHADLRSG